jgi:hypothetical protein
MKTVLRFFGNLFGGILCVLVFSIVCIGYLFYIPFDFIYYRKTPYYKDFKVKYRCFLTSGLVLNLYNRIKKDNLPIEYVKYNDFEYFIKDNTVLLPDWENEDFEVIDGEWIFSLDDDSGDKTTKPMEEALAEEKELLNPEHQNLPTKFIVLYDHLTDGEDFEKAKECPYFYTAFSIDEI